MMNPSRRNFLRLLVLGPGIFLVWKLFLEKFAFFDSQEKELKRGEEFKVIEEKNKVIFLNQRGKKVLTINEGGEIEIGD